jgi:hypothetical protein
MQLSMVTQNEGKEKQNNREEKKTKKKKLIWAWTTEKNINQTLLPYRFAMSLKCIRLGPQLHKLHFLPKITFQITKRKPSSLKNSTSLRIYPFPSLQR